MYYYFFTNKNNCMGFCMITVLSRQKQSVKQRFKKIKKSEAVLLCSSSSSCVSFTTHRTLIFSLIRVRFVCSILANTNSWNAEQQIGMVTKTRKNILKQKRIQEVDPWKQLSSVTKLQSYPLLKSLVTCFCVQACAFIKKRLTHISF